MKPPLERNPTKKRHSWWWDSHISPKNSKWLAENLEEMDKQVKEMLHLIEEDGDSFAKKAQMYYQKRPMLISHVENFYRMYRALAERYDNVTGELRKNIPSGLQSQGSLTSSECGSEPPRSPSPSPEPHKVRTREPSPRAAGFDFFLNNKNNSPVSRKETEDFASQSESEAKSEDGEEDGIAYTLHQRVLELEDELNAVNEKLRDANGKLEVFEEKILRCQCDHKENGSMSDQIPKVSETEGELTATRQKLQSSQAEINNLRKSLSEENSRLSEQNAALEAAINSLKEEMASAIKQFKDELSERDTEISKYKQDLAGVSEVSAIRGEINSLKEQMASAKKQFEDELSKCRKELAGASEKLLQDKSNYNADAAKLQEIIGDMKVELAKISEEKCRLEEAVQDLKSAADAEADNASARLSEVKSAHEAEITRLHKVIEGMKSELENVSREKSALKSWFTDLEQVVGRGNRLCRE